MKKTVYKRTDITNFFTIEKIAYFSENKFDFSLPYPLERHDFFELQYMKHGCRVSVVNGVEITVNEGQILILPPDIPHMLTAHSDDAVCFVFGFTVFRDNELLPLCGRPVDLSDEERETIEGLFSDGQDCFDKVPPDIPDKGFKMRMCVSRGKLQILRNRCEIFFIHLIEQAAEPNETNSELTQRISVPDAVHDFLRQHISDKITLNQISDALSLSISYICREFKKKHGCGIIDYFLDMKIERAKQLIEETSLNFTQIAEYLSFESESHFSKTFSKRVGIPPGTYLKGIKGSTERLK
ncbi:MAG: helix-turn-helix domain-containing protein [Oscillospiraceae bacterium]|nr:helix-turn-helix domain-containing protein [Oscillospiraceae bacterium]